MPTLLHSIICNARPGDVYAVTKESDRWTERFPPCLNVEVIERHAHGEVIRITAKANETQMSWRSRRKFHDEIFGVDFEQLDPSPLVASMHGRWRSVPLGPSCTLLSIEHNFEVKPDIAGLVDGVTTRPEAEAFMIRTIRANSQRELQATKALVESGRSEDRSANIVFESRRVLPHEPDALFDLLANVVNWPQVLPHCHGVDPLYDDGTNQEFTMEVSVPQGREKIRSIRRLDRQTRTITYFQPVPPPVLRRHTGCWQLNRLEGGTEVVSRHEIELDPNSCAAHFGHSDAERHADFVKNAIERNSLATMAACNAALGGPTP